jgi:hypothetical protein
MKSHATLISSILCHALCNSVNSIKCPLKIFCYGVCCFTSFISCLLLYFAIHLFPHRVLNRYWKYLLAKWSLASAALKKKWGYHSWILIRDFVSKLPRFSCAHLKVSGLNLALEKVHLPAGAVRCFVIVVLLRDSERPKFVFTSRACCKA